jgi:hypothetical protein
MTWNMYWEQLPSCKLPLPLPLPLPPLLPLYLFPKSNARQGKARQGDSDCVASTLSRTLISHLLSSIPILSSPSSQPTASTRVIVA